MKPVAYFDEYGRKKLKVAPAFQCAAFFIEVDVRTPDYVDEILFNIEGTLNGSIDEYECTGDSFTIHFAGKRASLQCEYDDDVFLEMNSSDLREILLAWRPLVLPK